MMKKTIFLVFALGMLICAGFTSCGDDDDDTPSTGKAMLTIDGRNVGLNNAYWYSEENEGGTNGENGYHLEFYSFDIETIHKDGSSFPSPFSIVFIDIYTSGSLNEIPVGTFSAGKYNVYVVLGMDEDDQYEIEDNLPNGNLVVTKENGAYQVKLEKVYLDGNKQASFSYNGMFKPLPEGWHDGE